jgi:hypothetical protein
MGEAKMGDKSKLMKDLRALWEIEVGPDSSSASDVDADINKAYRAILQSDAPRGMEEAEMMMFIRDTAAWKGRQRMTAESTFILLRSRAPTEEELNALEGLATVGELSDAIDAMVAADATDPLAGGGAGAGSLSGAVSEIYVDAPDPVDTQWIDEFVAVYDRDPFVHEYVHLRSMRNALDLNAAFERFSAVRADMARVYRDYLNTTISDAAVVRDYTPSMFLNDRLVEETIVEITDSAEYVKAMKKRLSQVHHALFGDFLSSVDSEYAYTTRVRAQRLALTTDLNEVVISFREETDVFDMMMKDMWQSVLHRQPCEKEMEKHRMDFRADSTAALRDLHNALVQSLEYGAVVTTRVQEVHPGMAVYDVFEVVQRVLDGQRAHGRVAGDLDAAIESACEKDAP